MMDWHVIRNAEGRCKTCGMNLGISGQCYACAINDMERSNRLFMNSRTLSWWRDYWRSAVKVLDGNLKRPATMPEKLTMLKRLKDNVRLVGAPTSYTALALLTFTLDIEGRE